MSGQRQGDRQERLKQALRANLTRRKEARRDTAVIREDDGTQGTGTAAGNPPERSGTGKSGDGTDPD